MSRRLKRAGLCGLGEELKAISSGDTSVDAARLGACATKAVNIYRLSVR
jgi:hypothetical protein